MSSPATQPPTQLPTQKPIGARLSFSLGIAGLLGVLIGSIIQYFIISHGAEGTQNSISKINRSLSFVMPVIGIVILGFITYNTYLNSSNKLLYLFLLVILSFILNSISMVISLHSVKVQV